MSSIVVAGDTSGSVTLSAPAVAGSTVLTLPTATGTVTTNTSLAAADANINGVTVGLGGGSVAGNTTVGNSALSTNTAGTYNVAVGYASLNQNTASNNTAVGTSALQANTTGTANNAFGYQALKANTTGYLNTAVGYQAGYANTVGTRNGYFGFSAGLNQTASNNTAVGAYALFCPTTGSGASNSAFGDSALYTNTSGAYNTAIGQAALSGSTTGSNNTALGYNAGNNLITGGNGVYIGYGVQAATNATSSEIVISGNGVTGKGAGTGFISPNGGGVYQGNNSAAWSITSDQRLKKNIVNNNNGLSLINAIQVRNFEYRTAEEVTELPEHSVIDIKGIQLGVIAQELQLVLPDCVKEESTGVLSVQTDNLTWYLINAVKELKAELDALKLKVGAI